MTKIIRVLAILTAFFFVQASAVAQTFFGVPQPSFGIDEVAPSWPAGWPASEVAGFYYIDSGDINATDTGNTYGYPDKPRASIPSTIFNAGDYIELHGGPYKGGGQLFLEANGTAASPVWIRGASNIDRGEIDSETIIKGSYVYLENLVFSADYATLQIRPHSGSYAHHIVVRNNEFYGSGTALGSKSAVGIYGSATQRFHDVVVYNNLIYSRGDHSPTALENDYHGVAPSANVDRVWILNNHIHHMGGDSVQVGTANIVDAERASHIYISGNTFHDDHENAIDVKESDHIIIANNELYGYDDDVTGNNSGAAVIVHNMPTNVWLINNKIHDAVGGIATSGATNIWSIGNVVYNIHSPDVMQDGGGLTTVYNPDSGYSGGGAIHYRASDGGIINNTLFNYDTGIQLTTAGPYELYNNIFSGLARPTSYDIRIADSSIRAITTMDNSIFDASRFFWGDGTVRDLAGIQSTYSTALNSSETPTPLVDIVSNNYLPSGTSGAINKGYQHPIFATFESQYGVAIDRDLDQNLRISGAKIDIGAVESVAISPPRNISFQ